MEKLLVLFVHGLGGNKKTWGNFEQLLLDDDEISTNIDIEYYNYPTKLIRIPFFSKSIRIQDLSQGLSTTIDHKYSKYSNILLVCHSLGGLIAKQYLISLLKRKKDNKIKEVVFYATPHSGSGFAKASDLISSNHWQARQLRKDSDFIDLISQDFGSYENELRVKTTYVVGGLDAVVSRESSGLRHSKQIELIPEKGHIDIVKPKDANDLAFLILKRSIKNSITSTSDEHDLNRLSASLKNNDISSVSTLLFNKGRSWIESVTSERALDLLNELIEKSDPSSKEALWSRYLIAISRLFKYRTPPKELFSLNLIKMAEKHGMGSLFLSERMEFLRKNGERTESANIAKELLNTLEKGNLGNFSVIENYSIATSYFLLGNFFRSGGRYDIAIRHIEKARTIYNPSILSHQVEIAHCQYSATVCYITKGEAVPERIQMALMVSPELRLFSEALIVLTRSHLSWSKGNLSSAISEALRASEIFESISYHSYSARANKLKGLLECWRMLELGGSIEKAVNLSPEYASVLPGFLGDPEYTDKLVAFISRKRPSHVLGMLQFSIAFNSHVSKNIDRINLPKVLGGKDNLMWNEISSGSLFQAESDLRAAMNISRDVRVPLILD